MQRVDNTILNVALPHIQGKPVGLAGPDRLGVDQVVWYGAAIMALCWPATPSEVKFAADSLLEEAGFEPSVPRDTTNSRPPHVASADFPPTRKSRREHEPAPARTPGVFRGAESRILLPPAASLMRT